MHTFLRNGRLYSNHRMTVISSLAIAPTTPIAGISHAAKSEMGHGSGHRPQARYTPVDLEDISSGSGVNPPISLEGFRGALLTSCAIV